MKNIYFSLVIYVVLIACRNKPNGIDCSNCKAGDFTYYYRPENDTIEISRNDSLQVEKNIRSGFITKSKINWISPCEFESTFISSSDPSLDKMSELMKDRVVVTRIREINNDYYLSESEIEGMSFKTQDTTWFKK